MRSDVRRENGKKRCRLFREGTAEKDGAPFWKEQRDVLDLRRLQFYMSRGEKNFDSDEREYSNPDSQFIQCGFDQRAAAYILYPQAVPNKATIDPDHCLHLLHGVCGICKDVCEAKAIDYEQKEEKIELNVGAVILSPGYEVFDARLKPEFGYGRFPNVVSALEFERILSASGPYSGHVQRPSDGEAPRRIAFLQCVGSRDSERDYCSSICCMYATKEAIIAKEHAGESLQCDVFFMDMRAFSKGFEEYYLRAQNLGVDYIRSRPALIRGE